MSYNREHAILVTSWDEDLVKKARRKAKAIFPHVSNIVPHIVNGGASFFIPPDGSKEGWRDSDKGDSRRAEFIAWIGEQAYADGSNPLRYAEVMYAEDDGKARVESHN